MAESAPAVVAAPKHDVEAAVPKQRKAAATIHYPFWFGGSAASMAAVVTHPLDLVKVRLQTRSPSAPKSTLGTFAYVFRSQGLLGLYAGLSAALLRQMTYSTVRFGVYEDLKSRFALQPTPSNPKPQQSMLNLILMSSAAGLLGGIAGNPGDVLNVRMQSDASKPPHLQRNYKHALDGLIRMIREEGALSIFRGVTANSTRALLMNASQLASYDVFKSACLHTLGMADTLGTHFCASLAAGFVATTICSPVDVIKTRIMSAGGKMSVFEILAQASQKEGLLWMFRGWVPSFMRLGPQTICTMVFFEQHKKWYRRFKGIEE
ncbi:uncharacterized protein Z520_06715 [Fonsecaea multimorphosa CBS 102226]|uniref:Uncharacterized protein n=1 Tax=Fonsecaea multimorphosa CBS 102226 TaxID=1442371 RepID=A0A0D2KKX0_9EURO|nr:uncharacterized protein Z520_06715 [Fonsecaea multimorphosa CBS 102226]KIX97263.1 hypothetical protein Z520_06715 [Fonsecaea multimorphosa CBS 102226]OAL23231.1 hypothetical protein AYO22_06281 [Fonsecaea multimorphosa]